MVTKRKIDDFVKRLSSQGINVAISPRVALKLKKSDLDELIKILSDVKKETKINKFDFQDDKNQPKGSKTTPGMWVKKGKDKIIINWLYLPDGFEGLKTGLEKIKKELKESLPSEIPPKVPESIEVSHINSTKEVPQFLIKEVELGPDLKIWLPLIKNLEFYFGPNSIDLFRDGEWFFIWRRNSKIYIGSREYEIEGNFLIEKQWLERGHEVKSFPLIIGTKGEKIIDLETMKKENQQLDKFLS